MDIKKEDAPHAIVKEPEPTVFVSSVFAVTPEKEPVVMLECVSCLNTTPLEEPVSRSNYPGQCGHCNGMFRVVKK
jgi:hypothetical protein